MIFIIMVLFGLMISISIIGFSLLLGISPMPISRKAKRMLIQNLPLIEKGTIYELGSGWGGLALTLAKRFPHSQIVGCERSPIPWAISKCRAYFSSCPNLHLYRKNFYTLPLDNASLVVTYLFPKAMQKLVPKFQHELTEEALIASYAFSLPEWPPELVLDVKDLLSSKIYFYRKVQPQSL